MVSGRIDTHHHVVPPFYKEALAAGKGDPSGSWTPDWTLAEDEKFSPTVGISNVIFSLTSPGPDTLEGAAAAKLARQTNEHFASLRDANPSKYGFFAAMPPLIDTEAALAEIAYAFDTLKADGVTLFTRYGPGHQYLGHEAFKPIWKALNDRKAVVFIHPTSLVDTTLLAPNLPQPIVDYPHETTRTTVTLIASNRLRENPDCKVILSHAGGTLPYLAHRVGSLQDVKMLDKSRDEIMADIRSLYFDVALSSAEETIQLLLKYTDPSHLLYGSDYPYAPPHLVKYFAEQLDQAKIGEDVKSAINSGNALRLFPRFAQN